MDAVWLGNFLNTKRASNLCAINYFSLGNLCLTKHGFIFVECGSRRLPRAPVFNICLGSASVPDGEMRKLACKLTIRSACSIIFHEISIRLKAAKKVISLNKYLHTYIHSLFDNIANIVHVKFTTF